MSGNEKTQLPSGWRAASLGDLITILRGVSYKKQDATTEPTLGKIPILRATNIDSDLNFTDLVYVPREYVSELQLLEVGDIVTAASSGSRHVVGKAAALTMPWIGSFGAFCYGLRPHYHETSSYISLFLQTSKYRDHVSALSAGVNINNLRREHIEGVPIPVAPLNEQHRIVAKIEELFSKFDKGIESLKAAREKLDVYRQAVLKHAFEGKLTASWREENKDKLETPEQLLARIKQQREERYEQQLEEWKAAVKEWEKGGKSGKKPNKPKKVNDLPTLTEAELMDLPKLPDEWGWVQLGNLSVEVSDGPFGSNLKNSDYVGNGIRVIRLENIGVLEFHNEKVSYITPEKYKTISKHNVTAGDVIVSSFVANGIRAVVLPKYIERAINKADCFCIRCNGVNPINSFIVMFLVTRCAHRQLGTQVHGATRPRINTTQLRNCAVPLVSRSEQELIALELEEKLALIEELETDIEACVQNAATLRQSILKRAFSGQLVPQDPDDEPASVLLERIKVEIAARSQNNARTKRRRMTATV